MKSLLNQSRLAACVMTVLAILAMAMAAHAQTRYATGTTEAAVLLGPSTGQVTIESVYAASDKAGAKIAIHAWDMQRPINPSAAHAATNIVPVAGADDVWSEHDPVVYVHPDGAVDYRTVSAATATNVTLSANLSQAGGTSGRIYTLKAAGQLPFDTTGAGVGTNKYASFSGSVWRGLAPVRVAIDGTSNTVIQVTSDR